MGLEDETRLSRYIMKSSHFGQRRESLLKLLISWELRHLESNTSGILILIVLWRKKKYCECCPVTPMSWLEFLKLFRKKNSFWRVFLFLAGSNANFLWRPNSFRFQALHPSIFRTAANLPIIIIQNIKGLWNCWNLFVVEHPAWWLTV